jgi:hypothetical protein
VHAIQHQRHSTLVTNKTVVHPQIVSSEHHPVTCLRRLFFALYHTADRYGIACWLQERDEALKVYGTLEQQQQQQADNTFEPGEGLLEPAAAAAAGEDADADGASAADAAAAAKPTAAPTAEQLTAIKAAVANAQTLEDAYRLEQSLKAGDMPSALARKEEQQQQQQQQDGPEAMDEG